MSIILKVLAVFLLMIPAISVAGTCWDGGSSGVSPWTVLDGDGGSASCAYNDVNYCVNTAAGSGDVVIVGSGTATWNSTLTISGSITLYGQTSGCPNGCNDGTKIIAGTNPLITIDVAGDKIITVYNLTLDGDSQDTIINITNSAIIGSALYNLRIYSCELENAGEQAITTYDSGTGIVFGLVDNCKFTSNKRDFALYGPNTEDAWIEYLGASHTGTNKYFYMEDNVSTGCTYYFLVSGTSARWVSRYNTIAMGNAGSLYDIHGDTQNYGVIAAEIYNNTIDTTNFGSLVTAFDYRGGVGIIYDNVFTTSGNDIYMKVREEQGDFPSECGEAEVVYPICDIANGYIWNNISANDVGVIKVQVTDCDGDIAEDTNWWDDGDSDGGVETSSNFTKDVAANRSGICSDDDCYWETDNKRLYRCVGDNNWTLVYTPYTYPHPLRMNKISGGGSVTIQGGGTATLN